MKRILICLMLLLLLSVSLMTRSGEALAPECCCEGGPCDIEDATFEGYEEMHAVLHEAWRRPDGTSIRKPTL